MRSSRRILIAIVIAASCGTLIGALRLNTGPTILEPIEMRVQLYDDLMHVVDGAVVAVEHGTNVIAHHTDAGGITPVFDFTQGQTVTVSLDETTTAHGLCLGQTYTLALPVGTYPNATEFAYTRAFFQPVLTPVAITNREAAYSAPYHARWVTFPSSGNLSSLRFQANVGMLLNPAEISAFEDYYDVQFTPTAVDFELGVVVKCARTDLGVGNLMMAIDCRGHGFTSMPGAATFLVKSSADPDQDPRTFTAAPIHWESTTETVVVDLGGVLERGFNIILIAETPLTDTPARLPGNPTHHTAIDEESGDGDCVPSAPSPPPDWSCTAAAPTQCPAAGATALGSNCDTTSNQDGDAMCGAPGQSRTKEITIEWEGSVSVEISLPGGNSVTASGGVSYSSTSSATFDFQSGANGCGQCCALFTHVLICGTVWESWFDKYLRLEHIYRFPCGEELQTTTTCTKTISTSGCCSRTCD